MFVIMFNIQLNTIHFLFTCTPFSFFHFSFIKCLYSWMGGLETVLPFSAIHSSTFHHRLERGRCSSVIIYLVFNTKVWVMFERWGNFDVLPRPKYHVYILNIIKVALSLRFSSVLLFLNFLRPLVLWRKCLRRISSCVKGVFSTLNAISFCDLDEIYQTIERMLRRGGMDL